MKTLKFTEENKEVYEIIYESVVTFPVKGIEDILRAATVIEKLKSVGTVKEEKGEFKVYKLTSVPTNLELEDAHFNYIKNAFDNTAWNHSLKIELMAQAAKLLKFSEAS
jgi:hypothetical protein